MQFYIYLFGPITDLVYTLHVSANKFHSFYFTLLTMLLDGLNVLCVYRPFATYDRPGLPKNILTPLNGCPMSYPRQPIFRTF
jgi:hypothetical protein